MNDEIDYKPEKLIELCHNFPELPKSEDFKDFAKVVASLTANIERLQGLIILPSHLIDTTTVTAFAHIESVFLASGGKTLKASQLNPEQVKVAEDNFSSQYSFTRTYSAKPSISEGLIKSTIYGIAGKPKQGLEALMGSILINAWMVFESCAANLWMKAISLRPKSLAWNVVMLPTTSAKEKKSKTKESPSKQQEPRISFTDLAAYDFNISSGVGEFLKEQDRVRFDSMGGIRNAYCDAFRIPEDKEKRTSNVLTDIFDKAIPDLKCLESMRNLLAHRGGVVDQQFLDQVEPYSTVLFSLPLNKPLPIDGELVDRYVIASISACKNLLKFTSDWINKNSE